MLPSLPNATEKGDIKLNRAPPIIKLSKGEKAVTMQPTKANSPYLKTKKRFDLR